MTRVKRLQRIVSLADTATRNASQQLGGSRRQHDETVVKLAQFERYREEYERALLGAGTCMSAARAREMRQFIAQIDVAIDALQVQASRAEQQLEADRMTWTKQSQRTRALADVRDRAAQADARRAAQSAQTESDDRPRAGVDD